MTKVFIGGSRRVTRLDEAIQRRMDKIVEQGFPVLVGDANGADKAVQKYLQSRHYSNVEVFCTGGECRNNLGGWPTRTVPPPAGGRGFDFYAAKDERMAEEASVGLMIWDGKSVGTLTNMARLVRRNKKVVVYTVPSKRFLTLSDNKDWEQLVSGCEKDVRNKALRSAPPAKPSPGDRQTALL
jgi:hypothetical protein